MKQIVKFFIVSLICKSIYGQPASQPTSEQPVINLLGSECSNTAHSSSMYPDNLNAALSALVTMAGEGHLSGTSTKGVDVDVAQALYYCRGMDLVSPDQCENCVRHASLELATCSDRDSAIAWYVECTVQVANSEIIGVLLTDPVNVIQLDPNQTTPDPSTEQEIIREAHIKTLTEAKTDTTLHFGANFIDFGTSVRYGVMAQCSPHLSSADCQTCLDQLVGAAQGCAQCRPGPLIFAFMPSCQYFFGYIL